MAGEKLIQKALQAARQASGPIPKNYGSFSGTKLPDAEKLARLKDKFIYHSGTADQLEGMKWGLEPQHGGWIEELAQHAGDMPPQELLDRSVPLVWMSDDPSWVSMKVGRKLNKPAADVTQQDILEHGHLAVIPRKGEHAENVWKVGEEGLMEGEYSPVTNLRGETKKAGWTDLYQNDYKGNKEPFGVERNEYVSAQPVEPMFNLTGQHLVDFLNAANRGEKAHGGAIDAALHAVRRHFDGEDGSYVDPNEPRPLTIYRGNAPIADEAGGSGREPTPAPSAFSYMPTPESVARQAARQPAYNPAERTWSDAGSTEGERLTRALGVEGELPKGETFMSAQPTGLDKYMPQRVPGTYLKRTGEAFGENADAVTEGLKAVREGNYGAGALGMVGGGLGMALSPLTGMERVLVRDPYLRMTGNLKDAQAAEMVADTALTGGVRGMVTPFAKAGSLERMATEPWNRARMPSPGAAGAATAAGAMLAPEDAEASKLSKAMDVARMAIPRELSPLGFYSHGAEAARGLAQAKGTPQQFASMLEKAGVRGPEMESYLKTFGGRPIVTQEEIAKHFQETMPKVEERVLGLGDGDTKFEQYALPGGENYREVLLKSPLDKPMFEPEFLVSGQYPRTFSTRPEAEAYLSQLNFMREQMPEMGSLMDRFPVNIVEQSRKLPTPEGVFQSSHWSDPNVLAHLRMSDRTGPNGERILHVEEVQSDWGQAGRDKGFADPAAKEKLGDLSSRYDELGKERRAAEKEMADLPDYNDRFAALQDRVAQIGQERDVLSDQMATLRSSVEGKTVPTAPYVTSTQGWTDLALKRALNEAAEGGYDRIVFTPGAEQAKRYDLSKQIDALQYVPASEKIYAYKNGQLVINKAAKPEELEGLVGKDVAKKLLETELQTGNYGNPAHYLAGQDLSVGGEGMKGYYDKILPKRLQELIKKHDPEARVGAHEIPNSGEKLRSKRGDVGEIMNWHPAYTNLSRQEQSARWNAMTPPERRRLMADYEKAQSDDVMGHGIDITPAMRESILRGQSAHARGGEVVDHALHAVRRHFDGSDGSYVDPMGSVAIPEAREPSDEPGLVDRAMSFVSQFNPVGSAEAGPLKEAAKKAAVAAPAIAKGTARAADMTADQALDIIRRTSSVVDLKKDPRFWHNISSNKLATPLDEMAAEYKVTDPAFNIPIKTPSDYEGKAFVSASGDPTLGGADLIGVNGQKLITPTKLQAGPSFTYGASARGPDKAVWASDLPIMSAVANRVEAAHKAGFDPYLNYIKMGGESPDYSHHISDTLLDLIKQSKVTKGTIEDFDTKMKKGFSKDYPAYPDWPGLNSPDLQDYLYKTGPGKSRTAMAKLMASGTFQKLGMPDVAAVRFATIEPRLLNSPNYSSGSMIARMDPFAKSIRNPAVPHKTYGAQLAAHPEGADPSMFSHDVPLGIMHNEWVKQQLAKRPDIPASNLQYIFSRENPTVYWRPENVDRVSRFLDLKQRGLIP